MTAHEVLELHALIEERRLQLGLLRWQVAVQMDTTPGTLQRMARGIASKATRERAQAWLHRHPAPLQATASTQEGSEHDDNSST